jgi:putative membrane protein
MIVSDGRMSWFRLLFEYHGSTLPKIRGRLFTVFVVACLVTVASEAVDGFSHDLTVVPFTLIGLALGVFLGFRNNTSYDRYWEGRKLWGRLVNDSRSLARLVLYMVDEHATGAARAGAERTRELQRAVIYRTIAFAHALRLSLRDETDYARELQALLSPEECGALPAQRNVPLFISVQISARVAEARRLGILRHRDAHLLENMVTDLVDVQGGCERIRNTPIPWSYTLLMHSIVATYCFALPFGLVGTTHMLTPVVVVLIAYAFLGLDAVGDELEQPFGREDNDLPLVSLSRMIEINLRQMLGESALPDAHAPDARRVLD